MTLYLNGRRQIRATLSVEEIDALRLFVRLVETTGGAYSDLDEDVKTAIARLVLHTDGPPVEIYDQIQKFIEDGITWNVGSVNQDKVRVPVEDEQHGRTLVTLEVVPDGDVDDDTGRPIDATWVQALWFVDGQTVEFEIDDAWEVIDQWRSEVYDRTRMF
jgi:hypothetical protein